MPEKDLQQSAFSSKEAFEVWLGTHGEEADEIWIKLAKKASGIPSITYAEALDVALCFGWIDGHKRALDGEYWLQRFTPRKAKSKWSQINCDKATELVRLKKMRPAGARQIELAKQDGRWEAAYPSQAIADVPDDLETALSLDKKAKAFFATLDGANRYAILYRLHHTKKPEARARKIAGFVEMLREGRGIHEKG